jgi:15-cis-phytoene synthase
VTSALESAYADAERVTAHWAKSFHFASRFLPVEKKLAIFALYDYCRHADNLVDARGDRPAAEVRADLVALANEVRAIHGGAEPTSTRWLALADTLQRYPVPLPPLLELLDGVAMDLEPVEIEDFPALEEYCRLVAGGVGLMLGPILGAPAKAFHDDGVKLGVAMQLTNVLRDVGEDLAHGRVYLPRTELAEFGLTRQDLEERRMTPELRRFMQWRVVPLFPNDGSRLTVRLLAQTYAGILDAIERLDWDVFRSRAYVSTPRKLVMLGRAVLSERLGTLASSPAERSV